MENENFDVNIAIKPTGYVTKKAAIECTFLGVIEGALIVIEILNIKKLVKETKEIKKEKLKEQEELDKLIEATNSLPAGTDKFLQNYKKESLYMLYDTKRILKKTFISKKDRQILNKYSMRTKEVENELANYIRTFNSENLN